MAFGTWLKGLISGIGNVFKKVIPIAKKVVQTAAPIVSKIGGMIGGKVGTALQTGSAAVSSLFGGNSSNTNMTGLSVPAVQSTTTSENRNRLLGAGGAGQRLIPRIK